MLPPPVPPLGGSSGPCIALLQRACVQMSPGVARTRRYDPAVEWVRDFYSVTGRWWGRAESTIGPVDHDRVASLHAICGETPKRILELGCGYGSTVAAMTEAGHQV